MKEANEKGLHGVKEAWEHEATRHVPALLVHIEAIDLRLEKMQPGLARLHDILTNHVLPGELLIDKAADRIEALETALSELVDNDDASEAFYDAFGHCRFCGYQARHTKTCALALARAALEGDESD